MDDIKSDRLGCVWWQDQKALEQCYETVQQILNIKWLIPRLDVVYDEGLAGQAAASVGSARRLTFRGLISGALPDYLPDADIPVRNRGAAAFKIVSQAVVELSVLCVANW